MATEVQAARDDVVGHVDGRRRSAGRHRDGHGQALRVRDRDRGVARSNAHSQYGYSTEADIERLYRDAPLMAMAKAA